MLNFLTPVPLRNIVLRGKTVYKCLKHKVLGCLLLFLLVYCSFSVSNSISVSSSLSLYSTTIVSISLSSPLYSFVVSLCVVSLSGFIYYFVCLASLSR